MRIKLTSTPTGRIVLYGLISASLRMVVGATSVIYLTAHGVSLAQIGAMKAMQAAIILLLDVPLSYLADRMGRIYVLVCGNIATALWLSTTAYSTSAPGFFMAEAFNAVGLAAFNGVFTAFLVESYEKEYGQRDFENILGWYGKWQFFLMAIAASVGAWFYMGASPLVWWIAAGGVFCLTLITPCFIRRRRRDGNANDLSSNRDRALDSDVAQPRSSPLARLAVDSQISGLARAASLKPRILVLAVALAAILLTFQVLLQFWQPVVEGALDDQIDVGNVFGTAFVVFLLMQSLASHCVQRWSSFTHGWLMRAFFMGGMAVMYGMYADMPVTVIIAAIALAFFVIKGLSIVVLADIQRVVPQEKWSTTESAISSLTRVLFIATMPFIGAFGDRASAQSIFIVILLFMGGAVLCLAWARTQRTFR